MRYHWIACIAVLALPCSALPCSICGSMQGQTWRQDATQAKLVLFGTLGNPRLNPNVETGGGSTDLTIEKVIKSGAVFGDRKLLELPRYVPVDPKNPPRYLIFCDVFQDKDKNPRIDPYRGVAVKSDAAAAYLSAAIRLDPKDRTKSLLFYFDYLDHRDTDVADDAFMEFAKASDQEIGQVGAKLSAERLRQWLADPKTPTNRIGLYAFLLGACGADADAAFLKSMIEKPTDRTANALDGLLCGYVQLREKDGWNLLLGQLRDESKPFTHRFTVLRTLRFFHGWKPEATRPQVMRGLAMTLDQGDLADLAIEDLRRWQWWDLTAEVLKQYGRKSHSSPIVRRSIVRYALCCPRPEARRFADSLRQRDAELVKEVEESLQFEKQR